MSFVRQHLLFSQPTRMWEPCLLWWAVRVEVENSFETEDPVFKFASWMLELDAFPLLKEVGEPLLLINFRSSPFWILSFEIPG